MTKYFILNLLTIVACSGRFYSFNEWDIIENKSVDNIVRVIESDTFHVYKTKNEIPRLLIRTLNSWDKEFSIVSSGDPYQATDMVTGKPSRQLIAIFKNERHFIMTYNHGGRGRHTHIMYFQLENNDVKDFWVG